MTDEDIFDLAERYGWQDDFGRWNFKDDGLISFALEVLRVNAEQQEPACWINGKELAGMRAAATHWGASEWKTNLGLKPMPDDVPLYTAPVEYCSYPKCQATNGCVGTCSKTSPTAWAEITKEYVAISDEPFENAIPLYTKRKWVGLTDEEIKALSSWWPSYEEMPALMTLVRDIQAKLRSKNSG